MKDYSSHLCFLLLIIAALSTSGCASTYAGAYTASQSPVQSPVAGSIYTEGQGPKAATSTRVQPTKEGRATAKSILGLLGTGDASIQAAMQNGDISEIHRVDYETVNYLGLYAEFTVVVYGE